MGKDKFDFKKFSICQDRCAMKVGTDGVLLGAWAKGGSRILDIGSGTGLVALMMAQRFSGAHVDAVELDADAAGQARENVENSPFSSSVKVYTDSIQDFCEKQGGRGLYDSIVSNPPFFVQSLKNPDSRRTLARHADTLPFSDLVRCAKRLLSEDGVFSLILPADILQQFLSEAYISGFFMHRQCAIKTTGKKLPKRYLIEIGLKRSECIEDREEILTEDGGKRSSWYSKISEDFYIY